MGPVSPRSPVVRRVAAAACVAVATLVALPGSAHAARPCPDPTLGRDIDQADVVFRGEVTKVRPVQRSGQRATRTYQVTADRVYKSSLVTDQVVVTARVGTRCALPKLQKGTRYIFFVTEHGSRLVAESGTAEATSRFTHQVVRRLGSGAQPDVPPPAAAQLTRVAGATPPPLSRLLAPGAALVLVSVLGLLFLGRRNRAA
jgi:hypothetical protein